MGEASSTSTLSTLMPSGGVCGVRSVMPRIRAAASSAAAGSSASFTPPALPRPPAWTWALTTTRPPRRAAMARASAGVSATSPRGTGTPNSRRMALAWYSWIFTPPLLERQLALVCARLEAFAKNGAEAAVPAQHRVVVARGADPLGLLVPLHGLAEGSIGHGPRPRQVGPRASLGDEPRVVASIVLVR